MRAREITGCVCVVFNRSETGKNDSRSRFVHPHNSLDNRPTIMNPRSGTPKDCRTKGMHRRFRARQISTRGLPVTSVRTDNDHQ
jgi:hypothetical protein